MSLRKYLRKNLLLLSIPHLFIYLMIYIAIIQLSSISDFNSVRCSDKSKLEENILLGHTSLEINTEGLVFSGFEYYENDKLAGKYYLYMTDQKIYLVLVREKNSFFDFFKGVDRKTTIPETIKIKVVKDENTVSYVMHRYAKEMGKDQNVFDGYFSSCILDEVAFPENAIFILVLAKYATLALMLITLVYMLLALINPLLNFMSKDIKQIAKIRNMNKKDVFNEIDDEVRNGLIFARDDFYITKNYALSISASKIEIIYIDNIKNLSITDVFVKKFLKKKIRMGRLAGTDQQSFYFQHDFYDVDDARDAVYYMQNPDESDFIEEEYNIEDDKDIADETYVRDSDVKNKGDSDFPEADPERFKEESDFAEADPERFKEGSDFAEADHKRFRGYSVRDKAADEVVDVGGDEKNAGDN